jgi:phosphoribosyl 1,2-cyclic phosphodiesterase
MHVTFWGVRGSTPAPGAAFVRYGGHTTCVSVVVGDRVLVLDAGTGIRPLGNALVGGSRDIFVLLTHLHADHLLGFPFFAPLYEDGRTVHLLPLGEGTDRWSPLALFDGVHYPLQSGDLPSRIRDVDEDALAYLRRHGFDIQRQPTNHPGGAFGYRVTHDDRSFVFIPDDELGAESPVVPREALVAFCRGADVLCHDAQYLGSEIGERRGWGHSSVDEACALAVESEAKHLVLFHHDPDRTDDELDAVQNHAQRRLSPHGIEVTVASQSLTFDFGRGDGALPPPTPISTRAESV